MPKLLKYWGYRGCLIFAKDLIATESSEVGTPAAALRVELRKQLNQGKIHQVREDNKESFEYLDDEGNVCGVYFADGVARFGKLSKRHL